MLKRDLLVILTCHTKGNDFAKAIKVVMTTNQFHVVILCGNLFGSNVELNFTK